MANFTVTENFGTYQGNVSYILDGSTSQTWRCDAQEGSGKYVLITSDELVHINTVTYTTGQSSEIFGSNTYLQVSTDGTNFTDISAFNGKSPQTFTVNADAMHIRIYSKGSGGYVSISEIAIDYQAAVKYKVTVQTGEGISIDHEAEEELSGGSYTLTVSPNAGVTISNASDNGIDILNKLEEHTVNTNGTVSSYPTSYSTSGSISGTRYRNCIGKGSSTTATGNDYSSGNSSSTATITYTFDFSEIPEGAAIDSVSVKVGGHLENTSRSTATLQLYSGNTAKGSQSKFTTTSKQIITMTPGSWTRDELQNAQLRFTIGYYGGLVNGVDFDVSYSMPSGNDKYYTYTISNVTEDHLILINVGAQEYLMVKVNGTYLKVVSILRKENGKYVVKSIKDLPTDANYVKGN